MCHIDSFDKFGGVVLFRRQLLLVGVELRDILFASALKGVSFRLPFVFEADFSVLLGSRDRFRHSNRGVSFFLLVADIIDTTA